MLTPGPGMQKAQELIQTGISRFKMLLRDILYFHEVRRVCTSYKEAKGKGGIQK